MSETPQPCSMNRDWKQCHEVLVCHLLKQQSPSSTQSLPQSSEWRSWEKEKVWGGRVWRTKKWKKWKKRKEKIWKESLCLSVVFWQIQSLTHSINPENSTQFNHNPILQFFINTHTHTPPSLTHIHHSNQQQHMSQSSIKSLPHQSSLFFITQINLFLPSLSLSLCLMWLNEWHSLLPNPSHITLHHSPLSLWMNCVDVDDCVVVIVININSIKSNQIKSNQESNTFFHISENEGRECASSTMHACARLKYDCGQPDSIPGRTPSETIFLNRSDGLETLISE